MDRTEAAAILGLEPSGFTLPELRAARNASLKAHHPDKAGEDAASIRRATYWAAQINDAFGLLEPYASRIPETPGPNAGSRASQSFADAARRAAERTGPPPPPAGATPPPRQPAGATPPPRPSTPPRSPSPEPVAGPAPAAGPTVHQPRATPAPGAARRPSRARSGLLALGAVGALAVLVAAIQLSPQAGSMAPVPTASPSATPRPAAATPSPPTPEPTLRPDEIAQAFFQGFSELDRVNLRPCLSGFGTCDPDAVVEYSDADSTVLAPEVLRLFDMMVGSGAVTFDQVVCREERGSLLALLAAMRAEIQVVDRLDGVRPAPQAIPSSLTGWEPCDLSQASPQRKASAEDIRQVLADARSTLAGTTTHLKRENLAALEGDGDELVTLGLDLVRRAGRDASNGDVGTSESDWQATRLVGADLVTLGMLLRDPATATSDPTSLLCDELVQRAKGIDDEAMLRNWR